MVAKWEIGAMTRDTRHDRTARLAALEQRVADLEAINVQRGLSKPAQTDQAKAIRFIVANQAALVEPIEKSKA
jgi:hypothetical protein